MRVLIAAGGTAGHINPALAIAGALKAAEPTAEIPATPAIQRRLRCPLWSATSAPVDADNAAPRAGDHLVVDGAEQIGPVPRGGLTCRAGPEQHGFVAGGDGGRTGSEVNDELGIR